MKHARHMFQLGLAAALILASLLARGNDEELAVWSGSPPAARLPAPLRDRLRHDSLEALQRRRDAYERVATAEDVRRWQAERRQFMLGQLGELPPRTPLHPRVVGTLEGEGYRVEKVMYESQPNHHVTANLYLPPTPPPYPAVIVPCGHSYNGKAAAGYQRVSILLARHGIAALCYDPIGQGERYQTFAPDGTPLDADYAKNPSSLRQLEGIPGNPRFNPVEEHTLIGISSILVGRNTATYRIWDGMRSIDYLVSREDIDAERIGCTGNSGGGTLTAYLMALDERIFCAAPACYLTTFERLLQVNGPQDAEQNLFGQIAFGLDQGDYVLMRAPLPTCLLAGTRDATFDIQGTWDIFREGKRFFARLDHPERVDMVEADAPHGFTIQLRVGATRWMRRWLLGIDDAVTEDDFPIWTDEQLQCTPDGQVMLLPGERSVFDWNREQLERLAEPRTTTWSAASPAERQALVRSTAGISAESDRPRWTPREVGRVQREGYSIEKLVLESEGREPLAALAFVPARPIRSAVVYLHDEGKGGDAGPGGAIEQLVQQDKLVLAVDLSGWGEAELAAERRRHWSEPLFGKDGESFWLAYLLGRSLVGLRTDEVLSVRAVLDTYRAEDRGEGRVELIGVGSAGLPALHAMALQPDTFASLELRRTLRSWRDVVRSSLGNAHLTESIHGVLGVYDLPDLVEWIGPERVRIIDPVVPQ